MDADRFWKRVTPTGFCWEWDKPSKTTGYGMFKSAGKDLTAHRIAYELLVGPIPVGLELDHLCGIKRCVNPDHLDPVTHKENSHRSLLKRGAMASRTHCKRGHEFTEANTYTSRRGTRVCRTCHRIRVAASTRARKEVAA